MKNPVQRYSRPLATIATIILGSSILCQAANIAFTGFETTDTWGVTVSGTGGAVSTETGSGDKTEASQRIFEGDRSFQISGTTVGTPGGTSVVDFNRIDVSAFDSIQLTLRVSSPSITGQNGNDGTDVLKFFLAIDGVAYSITPTITLAGNQNSIWGYEATKIGIADAGTPATFNGVPGGPAGPSTDNYSTLVINIPNSAHTVDFRIVGNNDLNEIWNIDNVSLTGTTAPIPEPGSMIALFGGVGMLFGLRRLRPIPRIG